MFAAIGLLGVCFLGAAAQEQSVKINVVRYDGLKEAVLKQRGKVVIVDLWQDTCLPCKRNMPHLVKLANEYAGKGLAVITVSVDPYKEKPEVKDSLEKFLTRINATKFTNLLVDEPWPFLSEKLHFKTVPTVFVFDRRGQWVQFTDEVDPNKVDETVKKLLSE
jgi:thiol-disulfide isomerase/thioredoxin